MSASVKCPLPPSTVCLPAARFTLPRAGAGAGGDALAALAQLGERDREALLLHAWEGLDHADAGTVMGCSPGAFAVRLHRARRRFARELERLESATATAEAGR
jgi:RNA polymerase sigma-70 factor (ECF subfamily)